VRRPAAAKYGERLDDAEADMHLRCTIGFHSPSSISIVRRGSGLEALCEGCGVLLRKDGPTGWQAAPPLVRGKGSS